MAKTIVNNNIKLKSGGGFLNGVDGLEADTSVIPTTQTMPAYEDLVAGDLLKTINDGGTYKLKKIEGINSGTSFTTHNYKPSHTKGTRISDTKAVLVYFLNQILYLRTFTVSGKTLTDDNNQTSCNGGAGGSMYVFDVKKVANNKFIISYQKNNGSIFAVVGSVSGTTITLGTEATIEVASGTYAGSARLEEVETNKFICAYTYAATSNPYPKTKAKLLNTNDLDNNITVGNGVNLYWDNSSRFFNKLNINKVNTNTFVVSGHLNYDGSKYYLSAIVVNVNGDNLTAGSLAQFTQTDSDMEIISQEYDTDKVFSLYTWKQATTKDSYISFMTRSGNTITETSKVSSLVIGNGDNSFGGKNENYYYHSNNTEIKKLLIDETAGLVVKKTYTRNNTSSALIDCDNFFIYFEGHTASGSFTNIFGTILLDHDEFITSANKNYNVGDSVSIVNTFTGFTGLLNGVDYYINSTGSGLTADPTYQKVGKAINTTTIIKS